MRGVGAKMASEGGIFTVQYFKQPDENSVLLLTMQSVECERVPVWSELQTRTQVHL